MECQSGSSASALARIAESRSESPASNRGASSAGPVMNARNQRNESTSKR